MEDHGSGPPPLQFIRQPKAPYWRGILITFLGWAICAYGFWSLCLGVALGANVVIIWPILLVIRPRDLPVMKEMWTAFAPVLIACLPGILVPLFGPTLVERGRRMRATDGVSAMAKDRRKPVLYLRSFDDDGLVDPVVRSSFLRRGYEPALTKALGRLGPVICLGKPGERYPALGAARLYVSDDDWQEAVRYLMRRAAAVVFAVGHTQSLWWEINEAASTVPVQRLLFFFPYALALDSRESLFRKYWNFIAMGLVTKKTMKRMDAERQARYQVFREKTRALFSALPPSLGASQFVDFPQGSTARLLEFRRTYQAVILWSFFELSYTQISFRRTLRPFINNQPIR